jgi:MinD-like ATPase involved in chromosome partitioning or flagellar assembly
MNTEREFFDQFGGAGLPVAPGSVEGRTEEIRLPEHLQRRLSEPPFPGRSPARGVHAHSPNNGDGPHARPALTLGPPADVTSRHGRSDGGGQFTAAGSGELPGEQLRATDLVAVKKIPSSRGWRKWLYRSTFGAINPGESAGEQQVRWMCDEVAAPLSGTFSVVVLGGKGGVGKTTATVAIGSTFAMLRPREQVIAIDADPGQGANLAVRIDRSAASSFNDIVLANDLIRYSDMRARVGHNRIGLDVLASPAHRAATVQAGVDAQLYGQTRTRLEQFYNILLTDTGVDIQHPVMEGVFGSANAVVLVTSAVPDGAEGAAKQMDWLSNHPRHRQVLSRMVLVINHIRGYDGRKDRKATEKLVDTLTERFGRWVPPDRIFVVPFDHHIATAGVIDLEELAPLTRRRFLEVSAALTTNFAADRR